MTIVNANINKDNVDQYDWSTVTKVNGDFKLKGYNQPFDAPMLQESGTMEHYESNAFKQFFHRQTVISQIG